ncbi:maleylpyruvate isomerase N-terminal domain-containing protein [Mycobacterium marinum]|uniref:maleylpyruvate isomerase N-terminal domain-containing protein n=1 Tax=Mycobacterium marinum TaxID=1781 RepID=UPI0035632789
MNAAECIALVDTSRDELRDRISLAHQRFDRLIRTADPLARPPGHDWTVQQIAAHVLTLAHRYHQIARGRDYRHAGSASAVAALNQSELEAALAPVSELADQLQALLPEIDAFFDANSDDRLTIPFHGCGFMSTNTAQTNLLGEFLLHGQDVAQAVKLPWDLPERDMALILRGAREMVPIYLRPGVGANVDICVAFQVPAARPYLIHIHDGTAEMRERRPEDRPDAVLQAPASTMTQLLYQRIGQFAAVRRGLWLTGGRRPWVAFKLMTYFERA